MVPAGTDRIKVVHSVESWLPQTQTWLYNHLRLLPEKIETHIVCQSTQNLGQFPTKYLNSLENNYSLRYLFSKSLCRAGLRDYRQAHLRLLENMIIKLKPLVLHSHFGHFGSINATLARKYGISHVVSFYGADVHYLPKVEPKWASRYRQMSSLVDLVLCEGPHMAACVAKAGIDPSKIHIFRLGIDLERLVFMPRDVPDKRAIRVLIAGSFREKKGIPYAIEALGLFSQSHPDIELTVVGDAGSSEREVREKQNILSALERSGLRSKTSFLGYQPYDVLVKELYRNDIFLSPSVTSSDGDTEGGAPVTIIEAAASGMPIVSTQHCDIPFVLSERNRPYLVPERDSLALSKAIQSLVQCGDWQPIVSANRQLIEEELDVRRQAGKLAQLYQLLGAKQERAVSSVV